jgi:hypothetical protein
MESKMSLFGRRDFAKEEELKELKTTVTALIKEKRTLKDDLEDLKLKKRLEQEEIKHLTKLHKEKMDSDLDKHKIKMEREKMEALNKFKEEQRQQLVDSLKEFHTKMEEKFSSELENLKDVLALLMKGLPNVNMEITKHIGDPLIENKKK